MPIPFTQYILPDGRKAKVEIDRSPEVETVAGQVIEAGGAFEIEILTTGLVSVTCEHHAREETLAHELCANGPGVPGTVDKVVYEAARLLLGRN